jgi:hypothetical protein
VTVPDISDWLDVPPTEPEADPETVAAPLPNSPFCGCTTTLQFVEEVQSTLLLEKKLVKMNRW